MGAWGSHSVGWMVIPGIALAMSFPDAMESGLLDGLRIRTGTVELLPFAMELPTKYAREASKLSMVVVVVDKG